MSIPSFATSEILKMRICPRKGLPHEDSTGLRRAVPMLYRSDWLCLDVFSHYLFHLNISCDYELSKVQKGFSY